MAKTYITFGQVHVHSVNRRTFDKDCVAVIECENEAHGRELAFEYFGPTWHQSYFEPSHQKLTDILHYFPRGLIEVNGGPS